MQGFKTYLIFLSIIFSTLALVLINCGGGGGVGPTTTTSRNTTYLGTQSPGDIWSWTITIDTNGNGTFSAKNETKNYTYSGTISTLPNKFLKLTVTASNDPGITVSPVYAYAFEIPDTALLVKPAEADSKVIVAAAQGTCPTANGTYNWITIPWTGWNAATDEARGVTNSTVTGSNFDFSHNFYLLSGSPATPPTGTDSGFTCTNGKLTKTGSFTVIGIAPSGVFVGDNGPNNGGVAGMVAPSINVDTSSTGVLAAGKEYRGVLFKNNDPLGDDTEAIWARPNLAGTQITGGTYSNFEAGTENPQATLVFTAQPSPGIVNGTLTDGSGQHSFTTMINKINGKHIIFGISFDSLTTQPYNFLVMEK